MKITKLVYTALLCTSFLIGSCGDESDDSSDDVTTTDDGMVTTDDNSGGGDTGGGDTTESTPDISGFTGYDQPSADVAGWELVFEDEFDSGLTDWTVWTGGAFNNELQHYQANNLILEDGYLFIREKRESVTGDTTPFDSAQKNFSFTSGRIESRASYSAGNTQGATKLRFSARILLPEGEGLWPAFWSYGDPWPTQGEIDVLEFRGNDTDLYVTNFFYGTSAGTPTTNPGATTYNVPVDGNLTANWHVFELIWSENTFEILLDNEVVHTFTEERWGVIDDIYNKTERLVLNMAVGGDFFQPNVNPADVPDEAFTAVDWVRVYKQ